MLEQSQLDFKENTNTRKCCLEFKHFILNSEPDLQIYKLKFPKEVLTRIPEYLYEPIT